MLAVVARCVWVRLFATVLFAEFASFGVIAVHGDEIGGNQICLLGVVSFNSWCLSFRSRSDICGHARTSFQHLSRTVRQLEELVMLPKHCGVPL